VNATPTAQSKPAPWLIPTLTATCIGYLAMSATPSMTQPASPKTAPDFTVKAPGSATNAEFQLSKAKGQWVALHFLLKTECPVCIKHTRDYTNKAKETTPTVQHVFLKPDSAAEIADWAKDLPLPQFPGLEIFQDENAKVAKQYSIPDGYKFHGEVVHYPALVLINPAGQEVFRYVGKANTDRLAYDDFTKKLAELSAK
jgi:peroxiredoxin Q/BCP